MSISYTCLEIAVGILSAICAVFSVLLIYQADVKWSAKTRSAYTPPPKWGTYALCFISPIMLLASLVAFSHSMVVVYLDILLCIIAIRCTFKLIERYAEKHKDIAYDEEGKPRLPFKKTRRAMATTLMFCIFQILWIVTAIRFLPDVTVISLQGRQVASHKELRLPSAPGMAINRSYVDTEFPDTLYRVIVKYAMPDKDKCNTYSVTDTIPPLGLHEVAGYTEHILRPIPLFMPPSVNRMGQRYHKKTTFIVTRRQLARFSASPKVSDYGLHTNKRVPYISAPTESVYNTD